MELIQEKGESKPRIIKAEDVEAIENPEIEENKLEEGGNS